MSEDTLTVVRRHLDAWRRGDIPALIADFADDGVVLTGAGGVLVGKEAIGKMLAQVFESVFPPDDTTLEVASEVVSGDFALVHWTATTSAIRTVGGFDTFAMRSGKIMAQCAGGEVVPIG